VGLSPKPPFPPRDLLALLGTYTCPSLSPHSHLPLATSGLEHSSQIKLCSQNVSTSWTSHRLCFRSNSTNSYTHQLRGCGATIFESPPVSADAGPLKGRFIDGDSANLRLCSLLIPSRLHDNTMFKRILYTPVNLQDIPNADSILAHPWGRKLSGNFDPRREASTIQSSLLHLVSLMIL
jgi:hypothetical protein